MGKDHRDSISELERKLEGLATRNVSDGALTRMEHKLDELDELTDSSPEVSKAGIIEKDFETSAIPQGKHILVAAAIVLLAVLVLPEQTTEEKSPSLTAVQADPAAPSFTVLQSSNRMDAHEDDGLIIPTDGGTPHYRHRYHIVDEEQIRDSETGDVITIRQPRQEVVTLPVTQF